MLTYIFVTVNKLFTFAFYESYLECRASVNNIISKHKPFTVQLIIISFYTIKATMLSLDGYVLMVFPYRKMKL